MSSTLNVRALVSLPLGSGSKIVFRQPERKLLRSIMAKTAARGGLMAFFLILTGGTQSMAELIRFV
jgi:hypothetical protein